MPRKLLLALAANLAASGAGYVPAVAQPDPRLTDRLVLTALAERTDAEGQTFTGVVKARVQSDLGFRIDGKVTERLVDVGDTVKRGQPLMRVDPTDFTNANIAETGNVASARARWIDAAADERRYAGLVATGAVSRSTYDQYKAQADSARAELAAAQATQKVSQDRSQYTVLLADVDGTVVETLAEPGQFVKDGTPVLRLAHAGPREAAVDLPETVRPALGATARAELFGGTVIVPAHLRQLSDAADPGTRTFEARFVLGEAGAAAPIGTTVTVTLSDTASEQPVSVPLASIDDEGHGPGVWVVEPAGLRVSYHPVTVSRIAGEDAIVSEGLPPGTRVVAAGGHELHPGDRVRIATETASMQ